MDPKTKRKPNPAGGQPTPAAIDAAIATPAANTPPADATPAAAPVDTTPAAAPSPPTDAPAPADAAAPADAPAAAPPGPAPEPEILDARVLVAFDEYEVDDIISAPALAIEQLQLAGRVDPHPDAVAFAKSLLDG
jgi:hypothetical protein